MKVEYEMEFGEMMLLWWTSSSIPNILETLVLLLCPVLCWIIAYYILTRRKWPLSFLLLHNKKKDCYENENEKPLVDKKKNL